MKPALLSGRNGFGDAVYARPIARELAKSRDLWVATAWPEVFDGTAVRFCRPATSLDGPSANVTAQPAERWSDPPADCEEISIRYPWRTVRKRGILGEVEHMAGVELAPATMDIPRFGAPRTLPQRTAVVRPVTARKDWPNTARNPLPEYVLTASRMLMEAGYHVVSLAAVGDREPMLGEVEAHQRFEHGELTIFEAVELVREASLVVGGPGWIVPVCLATGTPLIVIGGGQNGCNGHRVLVDIRLSANVQWIEPQPSCPCAQKQHRCVKHIPRFGERFRACVRGRE